VYIYTKKSIFRLFGKAHISKADDEFWHEGSRLGTPAIRLILYNWLKGIRLLWANFFPKIRIFGDLELLKATILYL